MVDAVLRCGLHIYCQVGGTCGVSLKRHWCHVGESFSGRSRMPYGLQLNAQCCVAGGTFIARWGRTCCATKVTLVPCGEVIFLSMQDEVWCADNGTVLCCG